MCSTQEKSIKHDREDWVNCKMTGDNPSTPQKKGKYDNFDNISKGILVMGILAYLGNESVQVRYEYDMTAIGILFIVVSVKHILTSSVWS